MTDDTYYKDKNGVVMLGLHWRNECFESSELIEVFWCPAEQLWEDAL